MKLFVIALMTALGFSATAADSVLLRVNMKKGDTYTGVMNTTQDITQTVQGMEQKTHQVMGFDMAFEIVDVKANGNMVQKITYTGARMKTEAGGMVVDYDSARDTVAPQAAVGLSALLGLSFQCEISPRNEIIQVTGADEMLVSLMEKIGVPEGPNRAQVMNQMKTSFGNDALKEMMEGTGLVYPEKAVAVGEPWQTKGSLGGMFAAGLENRYEVSEIKDDKVILKISSKVLPIDDSEGLVVMGMKMKMTFSGNQTGTMQVMRKTGLTNADIDQDMSGTMTIMEGEAEGMEIPMTINAKISLITQ